MQTKLTAKRLFAVVMAVLMMLTAIPFTAFAADETADSIVIGAYNGTPLKWQVLKTNTDGSLMLITESVIAKTKFGGKDFATSAIYTTLNSTFYGAAFSDAEKAAIVDTTVTYKSDTSAAATATAKVVLPSVADATAFGLTKAPLLGGSTNTAYWLADWNTGTAVSTITVAGAVGKTNNSGTATGYRPVITVKADSVAVLTAADGVSYTSADNQPITLALVGSTFKVVLDENYSESAVTVKANGAVVTAVNDVYTATASPITVEGVVANAADYTAYNEAVASKNELVKEDYTADSWAALEEALAADVADLTVFEQDKVDAAAKAITDAIAALVVVPADFTEYDAALAQADAIINNATLYDHTKADPETLLTYVYFVEKAIEDAETIKGYNKFQQELVDEATAKIVEANANVPYRMATVTAWKDCIDDAARITEADYEPEYYAAVQAIVAEVVAEHDYVNDPVTALYQADIDAAAQRMRAVIGDKTYINSKLLKADFTALEAALERAATYQSENYYKDEEVKRKEEVGGTDAWNQFEAMKAEAERIAATKENNPTKIAAQAGIDSATADLVSAMDRLDTFVKLDKWDRFVKDVKYFFSDLKYNFQGFVDTMKFVFDLLKMLFNGDIDLYGLFEMLDVDQEVLDFLISIGITPSEDEGEGEEEEKPAE